MESKKYLSRSTGSSVRFFSRVTHEYVSFAKNLVNELSRRPMSRNRRTPASQPVYIDCINRGSRLLILNLLNVLSPRSRRVDASVVSNLPNSTNSPSLTILYCARVERSKEEIRPRGFSIRQRVSQEKVDKTILTWPHSNFS